MTSKAVLRLYGRSWCHLCEDMRVALEPVRLELGLELQEFDVDSDPVLEARYDELVPVLTLECNGEEQELCHYHLDVAAVRTAAGAIGA